MSLFKCELVGSLRSKRFVARFVTFAQITRLETLATQANWLGDISTVMLQ